MVHTGTFDRATALAENTFHGAHVLISSVETPAGTGYAEDTDKGLVVLPSGRLAAAGWDFAVNHRPYSVAMDTKSWKRPFRPRESPCSSCKLPNWLIHHRKDNSTHCQVQAILFGRYATPNNRLPVLLFVYDRVTCTGSL